MRNKIPFHVLDSMPPRAADGSIMRKLYIITGANGHLGNTIIRMLRKKGEQVRGLILPAELTEDSGSVHYIKGDVRTIETLETLFDKTADMDVFVIHTAGIITISEHVSKAIYDVNVTGTKNIIELCMKHHVHRLVYVSSVHAIPESSKLKVLKEISQFSPGLVTGGYAKTKAAATQAVLAAAAQGLNAIVVQPSGIIGPYDNSNNHLVQLVNDYINGRLPACVNGGYDFVDVRDVAIGCINAAEKGRSGECYILSNRHYEIKDVLKMVKNIQGGKWLPILPMWVARVSVPFMECYAKCKKIRPLYTKYSLYALKSNDKFSHDKATRELNYRPRDLFQTITDTVKWLEKSNPAYHSTFLSSVMISAKINSSNL